ILHPRRLGIASHLGLALNVPTIGISETLPLGTVADGKILVQDKTLGYALKTKEHANPLYASPGHLVSLSTVQQIIPTTILPPHKLPEPLHLALRIARKKAQKLRVVGEEKMENTDQVPEPSLK
ncbi:MAG: endonuclease V, partial [Nanoarchaeota archaeon]|nr:endonuclease V [Nanoarchaeota archaeon]